MKPTKPWATRTLKAVDELIGQYKDGTHTGLRDSCPLCQINVKGGCEECPWIEFKQTPCRAWGALYDYENDPIPLRLRRLYGWRVRLKNIIKKGGK